VQTTETTWLSSIRSTSRPNGTKLDEWRLKRGELWTVAGGEGYAGKPRPVVILQDDQFSATPSVTFCQLTTNETDAAFMRLVVAPDQTNGLRRESRIAIDRIMTTPRTKLRKRIGRLSDKDMVRVNRAVVVFLGLAGSGAR
jgi:mRNA interferase MazF